MKLIIAGSRDATDYKDLLQAIKTHELAGTFSEIVSGTARGADSLGERYAKENSIALTKMPADWSKHGKSAGYKRNEEMAIYADALLVLWDGVSRGTGHMVNLAKKHKVTTYIHMI